MKFQPDHPDATAIRGYGPGWIQVGNERVTHSIVLRWSGERQDWDCERYEDLCAERFSVLKEDAPEVVIFGSGDRLRFPRAEWLKALIEARIGVETMDTAAACRTYNILMGEGRRVVAALLLPQATS